MGLQKFLSRWAGAAVVLCTYAFRSTVARLLARSEPPSHADGVKLTETGWRIATITFSLTSASIFYLGVIQNNGIAALSAMAFLPLAGLSLAWTVSAIEQNKTNVGGQK